MSRGHAAYGGRAHALVLPFFAFTGVPALTWFNVLSKRALAASRPLLKVDEAGYELLT